MTKALVTLGISSKALRAFLQPLLATLVVTVAEWIRTGTLNEHELRFAAAGALLSLIAGHGAYSAKPGPVALLADPTGIQPDKGDVGKVKVRAK